MRSMLFNFLVVHTVVLEFVIIVMNPLLLAPVLSFVLFHARDLPWHRYSKTIRYMETMHFFLGAASCLLAPCFTIANYRVLSDDSCDKSTIWLLGVFFFCMALNCWTNPNFHTVLLIFYVGCFILDYHSAVHLSVRIVHIIGMCVHSLCPHNVV